MTRVRVGIAASAALLAAILALHPGTAQAQATSAAPPNALQGFSQNRDKPIRIESATLEVRDKDKMATFSGDVHVFQGDTTLRCKTLVVFYEPDTGKGGTPGRPGGTATASAAPAAAPAGPGQPATNNQQIKRIEARGDVVVTQKDQIATGDNGIFEMKANTVTLLGNVVISQGQNIVKGSKLVSDLTTGVSRVECDKGIQCRVSAVIQPSSAPGAAGGGAPGSGGHDAQRDAPAKPRNTNPRGGPSGGGPSGATGGLY